MKWTTGLSRKQDPTQAFKEASAALDVASPGEVDVVLAFYSADDADRVERLGEAISERFPQATSIGCHAAGVVGGKAMAKGLEEGEDEVSLSITVGVLPGVEVTPLRFEPDVHDRVDFDWAPQLGERFEQTPHFLILSDPQTFETEALLGALDRDFPESKKFGGLVSGATEESTNKLLIDGEVCEAGAVGMAFSGELRVDTTVAQSCRPIGEPLIITDHSRNIIHRFDRGNPMEVFRELVHGLEGEERELAQHAMYVGIGVESDRGEYGPGDFVIRNIIGFNPKTGDLAVAAPIEDLDVLQFHLMDARTGTAQFEQTMGDLAARIGGEDQTRGALLFSGMSGGESMYGDQDYESALLRRYFGSLPIGGFFCDGEIAQVGRKTCLHGYASTVAVFREPSATDQSK